MRKRAPPTGGTPGSGSLDIGAHLRRFGSLAPMTMDVLDHAEFFLKTQHEKRIHYGLLSARLAARTSSRMAIRFRCLSF